MLLANGSRFSEIMDDRIARIGGRLARDGLKPSAVERRPERLSGLVGYLPSAPCAASSASSTAAAESQATGDFERGYLDGAVFIRLFVYRLEGPAVAVS